MYLHSYLKLNTDHDEVGSDTESVSGREGNLAPPTSSQPDTSTTTIYIVSDQAESGVMELRVPRPTNNWDKFRLLMWKNYLLQWRHKMQAVIEILVPVLFSALLVLIRYLVEPDVYVEPTTYPAFDINNLDGLR